jgi:hypothetical protein
MAAILRRQPRRIEGPRRGSGGGLNQRVHGSSPCAPTIENNGLNQVRPRFLRANHAQGFNGASRSIRHAWAASSGSRRSEPDYRGSGPTCPLSSLARRNTRSSFPQLSSAFTEVCLALASRGLRFVQQPAQCNEHRPCLAAFPRRCARLCGASPMPPARLARLFQAGGGSGPVLAPPCIRRLP